MRRRLLPVLLATGAAGLVALAAASPAAAHVEPEVSEVPAGSLATVQFNVEHGCDGSPTVKMEFQVPDGITDAAAVDKAGWTGSVVDGVVTYTGGSLPDAQQDTFGVRFSAPATVGEVLHFPMIQTCEEGQLDWIQLEDDAERPAPVVEIVAADPGAPATTLAPTIPLPTSTTSAPVGATSTTATPEPTTTTTPATGAETTEDDDGGSSATPWIVAGVVVVALGAGAAVVLARRRATSP